MKKNSQEVRTLSKLLMVSRKPIKTGKEILISKEKSTSIIIRYKANLKIIRKLVKPELAQETET